MPETQGELQQDARARDNAATALPECRTEGQRALRLVPGSLSTIAGAVGVDKGTISRWRSGDKLPNGPMRARLHALYAIAPDAWDRSPLGAGKPATSEPGAGAAGAERLSTLEETLAVIDQLKTQLTEPLAPGERKGTLDNLGKMLALRARLEEKGELMEARIVREHPRWRDIMRGLPDVLRPWPAAAEAVASWLAEMEEA